MRFRLLSALLFLAACSSSVPTEVLSEPFIVAYGQSVRIPNGPLLRFMDVEEDSRCPAGVQCVWAGNARIRIDAVLDGETQRVRLNTTLDPKSSSAFGYEITLVDVMPVASNPPQAESKYSIRIEVTKRAGS